MIKLENAILGSILTLIGMFVTCLNITVMIVLIRCGFLSQKRNGIYVLSFGNLIGDTVQQIMVVFYVGPSSIAQSFLVDGDRHHWVVMGFAYVFLFAWYEGIVIQGLIAVDRLLNVIFPQVAQHFSLNAYKAATVSVYVIAGLAAVVSQFLLPCCTAYIYYKHFGYSYIGDTFNYSDNYIDLPLNTGVTAVMVICYTWIYCFLRHKRLLVTASIDANTDAKSRRKHKEGKIALQFGIVASVMAFCWISFRMLPILLPEGIPQLYCLTTLGGSMHCASNAFIFLTLNQEFRRFYTGFYAFGPSRRLFFLLPSVHTSTMQLKSGVQSTGTTINSRA
ncbi:G-PROTEIN-RECEP-F1-2 domain-containing protein [Aphelenchoides bicaudatus]|nr:G-PROTEIN-RECEP-F1-2 domain-containing protein [Aphelenchoides bicaudatus]